jgi:hypothetical protein
MQQHQPKTDGAPDASVRVDPSAEPGQQHAADARQQI